MAVKQAEKEFAKLCSSHNIWAHKWWDVRYCTHCNRPIFPKRTNENEDEFESQESIVDYLIYIGSHAIWVECKGLPKKTSWPFGDMSVKQRDFLRSMEERGANATVFLSFGPGRAPDGRSAWWFPYDQFAYLCNKVMREQERKSLNYEWLKENAVEYELKWEAGGWTIPLECWIARTYPNVTQLPALF